MHDSHTIGMRGPVEIADIIRKYNVVKVSEFNGIITASGTGSEWRHLINEMRADNNREEGTQVLIDNIVATLPVVWVS